MSEELKPCPFCGGEAALIDFKTKDGTRFKYDGVFGKIECTNDDCEMCNSYCFLHDEDITRDDMIKAWNTRTQSEKPKSEDVQDALYFMENYDMCRDNIESFYRNYEQTIKAALEQLGGE